MQSYAEVALTPQQIRRNRQKLTWLLVVPFLVLGSAYFMFYSGIGIPTGTINKGRLITPPIHVEQINMKNTEGHPVILNNIWSLVHPISTACESKCLDRILLTRQVHLRQGKRALQMQRVILISEPLSSRLEQYMSEHHAKAQILMVNPSDFERITKAVTLNSSYGLVDQRGWLMMEYDHKTIGKDLLTDLKKLLN